MNGALLFTLCVLVGSALAGNPFKCRKEGQKCLGAPRCCGDLICSAKGRWNPFVGGTCGSCVEDGNRCVKDNQCCKGLHCNKSRPGQLNGFCRPPKAKGSSCYVKSQCETKCEKKWYQIYGTCV